MKTDFMERNHVIHVAPSTVIAANEDIFNGSPASDVISLAEADGAVFMIITNANAGGNASIYVYACDDVTPTNTTPIAFTYRTITAADTLGTITAATSAGFLTTTGANVIYLIEVDAQELAASGYGYCQLKCTEVTDAAVDGAIVGFLTGLSYKQASLGTQVT